MKASDLTWRGVVSALPDLGLAAVFAITWVVPDVFGERMVRHLMYVMLLEFIVVHSAAFVGHALLSEGSRAARLARALGFSALYLGFAWGFSMAYGSRWPLLAFLGLTLNRSLSVLAPEPGADERGRITAQWAAGGVFYVLAVFLTLVPVWPALGVTAEVVSAQRFESSGLWVDEPHRALVAGMLYFGALGITELRLYSRKR